MFKLSLDKSSLKLTNDEWAYVECLIAEPTSLLIYGEGIIDASKLIALGTILEHDRTGIMRLHIYHNCQNDPIEILPFTGTFPDKKPCVICKKTIGNNNETKYDIELIIKYSLILK